MPNMDDSLKDVVDTLRQFETAMLVTQHESKPPSARPMQIGEVDDDGTLWFLGKLDASWMDALESNSNVGLTCQRADAFASVSGVAEIYQFPAKLRSIWRASFDRWFPQGPDTPNAVAIRVVPVSADRWGPEGRRSHVDVR